MLNKGTKETLNILNIIFDAREDDIATMTMKDKENLKQVKEKWNTKENNFKEIISNEFENKIVKDKIISSFYECLEVNNEMNSYFNQKYYESGFTDAVKLFFNL